MTKALDDATVQASGTAPFAIEWRLGVRPGAPPFTAFVGDRYSLVGDPRSDWFLEGSAITGS